MRLIPEELRQDHEDRKVALHVNFDDPERLNYVLNNAENIYQYYRQQGKKIEIRIITHGPGLHMLRQDTSPVKERIAGMAAAQEGLGFYACTNTQEKMAKASKEVLDKSGKLERPIATEIAKAPTFYRAEEYHQLYYAKSGGVPYCHVVPK